jgi:hypothetical protein
MPKSNSPSPKLRHWNLYWVESDGVEDCFVVAKNSRSACRIEIDENGFDVEDVRAIKIMRIPHRVEVSYGKKGNRKWPWYVYGKEFFDKLGAQFRAVDGRNEMLLCDVVYSVEDYRPCSIFRERSIGQKRF